MEAVLVVLLAAGAFPAVGADPLEIGSGKISGVVVDEEAGVRVYRGIPFAAPPVGDLRWRPPQPAEPWDGVRACEAYGPACPQLNTLAIYGLELPETSEDCLYLNVWTAAEGPEDKLPVMFWIHGGGNSAGWGHQPSYDGTAFTKKGIVLVTINYRLGPYGFFSHPLLSEESGHDASGNYGILDQIAALEWVRDNIAAFGGDPGMVTIFGESAGGMDVVALSVSPLSKGLYHRAIIESGSMIWFMNHLRDSTPLSESAESRGEAYAKALLGEGTVDLAALRKVPAEDLLAKVSEFSGGPVVDGWVIPDYPAIIYRQGLQHDVPLLGGTNADEGTIFSLRATYTTKEERLETMRERFGEDADEILALYPAETAEELRASSAEFMGDTVFIAPTRATVRGMSTVSSKAYLYHFTRAQSEGRLASFGAFHGSEIPYVFNSARPAPGTEPATLSETDVRLAEAMNTYWAQFAKTGDPNGNGLPEWPVYETETDLHLELGDTIRISSGLKKEVCDLLDDIMKRRTKELEDARK